MAELVRESYGRLLALLAAPTGDIPAAEDAIADALERALTRWPAEGMPANPEGWILTVARNRLRDRWKSHAYRMTGPLPETDFVRNRIHRRVRRHRCASRSSAGADAGLCAPGDRRQLPHAADAADGARHRRRRHRPGLLDAALPRWPNGWSALNAESAMPASRSWFRRARSFDERLPAVLEAVYGARCDRLAAGAAGAIRSNRWPLRRCILRRSWSKCCPTNPRCSGLAALVCLSEARRPARRARDGQFVPLDRAGLPPLGFGADRARRDVCCIAPMASAVPGRYQYEAAIQSTHCARGSDDWMALRKLHRALLRVAPSMGAAVALAVIDGEVDGPQAGLACARNDPSRRPSASSPPGLRGRTSAGVGPANRQAAARAYRRAIDLTADAGVYGLSGPTTRRGCGAAVRGATTARLPQWSWSAAESQP